MLVPLDNTAVKCVLASQIVLLYSKHVLEKRARFDLWTGIRQADRIKDHKTRSRGDVLVARVLRCLSSRTNIIREPRREAFSRSVHNDSCVLYLCSRSCFPYACRAVGGDY